MRPNERLVDGQVVQGLPSGGDGGKIEYADVGFSDRQVLLKHYEKHKEEFYGYTVDEYQAAAKNLAVQPLQTGKIEMLVRSDGSVSKYDFTNNLFIVIDALGFVKTFFKPDDKEAYWRYEHERNE